MLSSEADSFPANAQTFSILEVTPHLSPDIRGGIPLNVDSLATALRRRFEVTVVANWMGSKPPPKDRDYSLRTFRTRVVVLGNPVSRKMLIWLVQNTDGFDIVHAHSHLFLTSVIAIFIGKLKGKRVVLTNHGLVSLSQPVLLQHVWIGFLSKTILPMCDKVVCFTEEDADRLLAFGGKRNQFVIAPNGVELAGFDLVNRTLEGTLRAVWLGRMVREKGLQDLLTALTQLRHLHDRIRVTLVGEGPLEAKLRKYAKSSDLDGMVTFLPWVERRDVPSILASHNIMILPSLSEGFPRVAIEALATGMPLLCSSLPQLTASLENCAIYFRPGDPSDIANALSWAEQNRDQLLVLGRRGRELVKRKYAWDATVTNWQNLFDSLLTRSGSGNSPREFKRKNIVRDRLSWRR